MKGKNRGFGAWWVLCALAGYPVVAGAEVSHDDVYWESVAGCTDAVEVQLYLDEFPAGRHVEAARACLERLGAPNSSEIDELLALCEVHFEARRLTTGVGGTAVECYEEVLSQDPGNRRALEGLQRVLERYAEWARAALGRRERAKAQGYMRKIESLNPEAAEVEELHAAIEELEAAERERARQERERVEAEAKKRAERERAERERALKRPGRHFRDCAQCPEMVVIPAGDYWMGSPPGEEDRRDDEGPRHWVRIPEPLAVGVYEVTFAEWEACVRGGGCTHNPDDEGWGRGNRPVINVSWEDAQEYAAWLSRETGERHRLLSESEWEYAARAGTTTRYHWGDAIGRNRTNCDSYCKSPWDGRTAPVGSFAPNGYGLHDVHGNVNEWVEDCWHDDYEGAPADGSAWTWGGDCSVRVVRGGSGGDWPKSLRSANRWQYYSTCRFPYRGFRIARTLD